MNELLEELCKVAEEENPEFDRNNPEDLDKVAQCFILTQENDEMKNSYLEQVIGKGQEMKMKEKIKDLGNKVVEYEMKILELEREIIEKKIEITKRFLN